MGCLSGGDDVVDNQEIKLTLSAREGTLLVAKNY
jgi:hypothetical protein